MTTIDKQQPARQGAPDDAPADASPQDASQEVPHDAPLWARGVTRVLDPQNVIVGVLVLVGAVRHGWAGVGWALFAAVFAGVIPQGIITLAMRRGKVADRYVGDRAKRAKVLPVVLVSVVVGLVLMAVLGAPRELIAMILAMFATLVPIIVITAVLKWKVSLHTAVSGGAVAMLGVALGAWWALGYLVVGLIAWSRVVLRDHTVAQTMVGALLGAVVAGLTFRATAGL
ncbi:phosphatase PAP2 family protein [Streptacidiphilus sp. MAP5-3]|uniref:phosphatase PAP2 family protein n=1 Tax=unclassified Streptacidiphilus TaxID=2643834 RepID=UPI003519B776